MIPASVRITSGRRRRAHRAEADGWAWLQRWTARDLPIEPVPRRPPPYAWQIGRALADLDGDRLPDLVRLYQPSPASRDPERWTVSPRADWERDLE